MEVLVATDGSEGAVTAARDAMDLLAPGSSVLVLAVFEPPEGMTSGLESGFAGGLADPQLVAQEGAAQQAEAEAAVQHTMKSLAVSGQVEGRIEFGDPGRRICSVAEEVGSDLIVVGSRGRGFLRRAILGSVSAHVVHNAPCPVLVVRARSSSITQGATGAGR
jgi:nucleotide-binding universal stress UspA family protein